jgi:hypothetical protein
MSSWSSSARRLRRLPSVIGESRLSTSHAPRSPLTPFAQVQIIRERVGRRE